MAGADEAVALLERKVEESERRLRFLDGQLRVLERERQKLAAVVTHADAGFLVLDTALRVVWANEIFTRLRRTGSHPAALLGLDCHRVLCGQEAPCGSCPAAIPFRSRAVAHHELCLESAGQRRHFYVTAMPILSPRGEVDETIVMLQDVSGLEVLRLSQEALRSSEERFRSIFQKAAAGMATLGAEGEFLQANEALCRFLGYSETELRALTLPRLSHPDDAPRIRGVFSTPPAADAGPRDLETRYVRKDGATVWGRVSVAWLPDAGGAHVCAVALLQDVTEHRRAVSERQQAEEALRQREEQLRHSQKMEAIGTLAGGVAHDFNNILTAILGYAQLLKAHARPGEKAYQAAEVIEQGAARGAALTQQLLGFARKGKQQEVAVDLHGTIQEVVGLLCHTIDKNISIRQTLCPEGAAVRGDPGQIEQVILNLVVNSRDAMPQGGVIGFATEIVELDDTRSRLLGVAPGPYATLSVSDTGCGIPDEIRARIFEPFFTTKERGKGTGMGLAMVYGIVRNHGGAIQVESQLGRGTTVRVFLPRTETERLAAADESASRLARSAGAAGRILVVDDEEMVRSMVTDLLRHLGYDVLTAADGKEAVERYARSPDPIDAVLLDMVMPRMGGRECFRALKALDPHVRAILSTGHGFHTTAQELIDEGVLGLVPKPYHIEELAEMLAKALKS